MFTLSTSPYTIARTPANVRGREILAALADHDKVQRKAAFSVSICNGLGEVHLRNVAGEWQQRVDSCDRVFGFIRGKWHRA